MTSILDLTLRERIAVDHDRAVRAKLLRIGGLAALLLAGLLTDLATGPAG